MAQAVEESGSDAFIISDEIYRDLYYTGERPGSISEFYPRTVVISGLSKSTCMTGWRLGWILGDAAVIRPLICCMAMSPPALRQSRRRRRWPPGVEEAVEARQQIRDYVSADDAIICGIDCARLRLSLHYA